MIIVVSGWLLATNVVFCAMLCNFCHLTAYITLFMYYEMTALVSPAQLFPRFSLRTQSEVRTQTGLTVKLHCYVENISKHTVTWIRQMDLEILSAGAMKVSTDPRIKIHHQTGYYPRSHDYTLEISGVEESDVGLYDCQINMIPLKSFIVQLVIDDTPEEVSRVHGSSLDSTAVSVKPTAEPRDQSKDLTTGITTEILGSPDIYFNPGILINLTCIVTASDSPGRIFWYHEDKVISYYSAREGVSVYTDRKEKTVTVSSLLLKEGSLADEGTYTCRPEKPFLKSAKTRLFIIHGSRSEATRTNGGRGLCSLVYTLLLVVLNMLFNLCSSSL